MSVNIKKKQLITWKIKLYLWKQFIILIKD